MFPSSKGKDAETDFGMKALFIINNFAHDLFTGLWTSTILVIYLLDKKANSLQGILLVSVLHDVMRVFFWLGIFSILAILITGIIRLINYRPENEEAERVKKGILIFKHILLGAIFIGGTYLAYRWTFY